MSYIAAGVAVAGVATQVVGGMNSANAARKAAGEQEARAQDWSNYVKDQERQAIDLVRSPAQLASFDMALRSQEQNVRRQEELVRNLDPALISAGKQTMDLLNGKSAPVLANLQTQRATQREQFVNDLTAKYGPGAMSSAIGMQQLQKFDLQTADIMNQAQQSYLDKVSNIGLNGANVGATLSAVNKSLADINTESPDAQAARLMAQFTGEQGQAQQALVQSAGSSQVANEIQGQTIAGVGAGMTTLGGIFAGSKLMNQKPGATPGTPGSPTPTAGGPAPLNPGLAMNPDIGGSPQTLGGAVGGGNRSAGVGIPSYGPTNPAGSFITPYSGGGEPRTLGYALGDPYRYGAGNNTSVVGGN